MAIRVMHSFDYSTSLSGLGIIDYNNHNSIAISSTRARTGTQSFWYSGVQFYGAAWPYFPIGVAASTVWIQFAEWWTQYPDYGSADQYHIVFRDGSGNNQVLIGYDTTDRRLKVYGPGGLIGQGATTEQCTIQQWVFMEITVHVADAPNGSVVVKKDGIELVNITGVDTNNGSGVITTVHFTHQAYREYQQIWMDDLIIGDNVGPYNTVAPGDSRVEYLKPIGAGNLTQFTPLSGSNWGNVDETGNSNDSDYNTSPDTGATDLFAMSDLTGNGLVHGVQTIIRARKDDAGYRKIRPEFYKSDGTGNTPRLYGGLDQAVTDTFAYTKEIFEESPDTNVAWTVDEVADLQYGYSVGGGSQFSTDAWIAAF